MAASLTFAACLALVTLGLAGWLVLRWRALTEGAADAEERSFWRWQLRRRAVVCLLLGLIAAAIAYGPWVRDPAHVAPYWLCVLALLGGVLFMAACDLLATRFYAARLHNRAAELAALRAAALRREAESRGPAAADGETP